jgi:hypothetical protein
MASELHLERFKFYWERHSSWNKEIFFNISLFFKKRKQVTFDMKSNWQRYTYMLLFLELLSKLTEMSRLSSMNG